MAKKSAPARVGVGRAVRKAAGRAAAAAQAGQVREAWKATVDAFNVAENEVERQVRDLVKKGRVNAKEARGMLTDLSGRLAKERKKGVREVETRLKDLQHRMDKERKAVGRMVDDAVRAALAAFNIPSRNEVAELTRKVDELSRKIDSIKRTPTRRAGMRARRATAMAAEPPATV